MKFWLSLAAHELRDAINFAYLDRDKRSDGWIGDAKHRAEKSEAKASAESKLAALGLTAEEIAALRG